MEISRNLSKQPFSTGSGRITLKNCLRDYFYLLKFPDFRCVGSYLRAFTVFRFTVFSYPELPWHFLHFPQIRFLCKIHLF